MGFGLILLLILYIIWDVNYFIRCIFSVALGRLFQRKRKINETTTIYGIIYIRFYQFFFFFLVWHVCDFVLMFFLFDSFQ